MLIDIITIVLLLAILALSWYYLQRKQNDKSMALTEERLKNLSEINTLLRQELDKKLSEVHQSNREQFGQSAKLISNITEKLTKLDETNRQVVNFSEQLQNLQDILKNPKHRGVLGEYYLEETLKNVLDPNSYQMQYSFKDGVIVSPTSFLAYLQTVLQGLRAMQIEESAQEIKKNVEKLGRHILSYDNYLQKLGNTLSTSVNHYNSAYKEFKKMDKDVTKISNKKEEVETMEIEKPKQED
jgi:DNA anti-recombination protein RmuC